METKSHTTNQFYGGDDWAPSRRAQQTVLYDALRRLLKINQTVTVTTRKKKPKQQKDRTGNTFENSRIDKVQGPI